MDAAGAKGERADSGRRSRTVLTPRRWRQVDLDAPASQSATETTKPGLRGDYEGNR